MTTLAPASQRLLAAPTLEDALTLAAELVHRAEAVAAALDLDAIDLPDLGSGGEVDAARLHALPALYLACELEEARLVPAAETLSALYVSGGLGADVGDAGDLLIALWRSRNERFNREEREAFFRRLFGSGRAGPSLAVDEPVNEDFEGLLIDLAAAIHRLEPYGGSGLGDAVSLRTAATMVAASLSARRAAIPEPAARELLAAVKDALEIFKRPEVQRAVGALGPWGAVAATARRYLREQVEVPLHVERARTGLVLLAWLAETAAGGGSPATLPSPEVRAAAQTWLEATLSLHERENGAAAAV